MGAVLDAYGLWRNREAGTVNWLRTRELTGLSRGTVGKLLQDEGTFEVPRDSYKAATLRFFRDKYRELMEESEAERTEPADDLRKRLHGAIDAISDAALRDHFDDLMRVCAGAMWGEYAPDAQRDEEMKRRLRHAVQGTRREAGRSDSESGGSGAAG